MSDYVKQHIVPVLYLRNFSINDRVFCYLPKQNKICSNNINNVAEKNNNYTINSLEDKYEWEKIYSLDKEPKFKNELEYIIDFCDSEDKNRDNVNKSIMRDFADSLYYQLLRCDYARNYAIKKVVKQNISIYQTILAGLIRTNPSEINKIESKYPNLVKDGKIDWNEFEKEIGLQAYKEVATGKIKTHNMFEFFHNRNFTFYKINFDKQFITCDDPVMLMNINSFESYPFINGLQDINTALVFPVNPKILAISYNPKSKKHTNNNTCVLLDSNKENINFIEQINISIFKHGINFVISKEKPILENLYNIVKQK